MSTEDRQIILQMQETLQKLHERVSYLEYQIDLTNGDGK